MDLCCSDSKPAPKPAPKPETKTKGLFSEASDGSTLVGNEIATASKKQLQLGDLFFTWFEVSPRSGLIRAWSAMTRPSRASVLDSPR